MLDMPLTQLDADLGLRKEVFVINDIALLVPPTAISVQKEDLTFTWRTLRTRSSTKVPTGHGSINIGLSLIFTNDRIIDLHRLVLQMRSSPFCYIENRYLRETIVPEWNHSQLMAFCMDAIQISPLAGTSNAWVCQMSLSWFNYAPYTSNFLFREEWETEWLSGVDDDEDIRHSIGWIWNKETGKREFSPSTTNKRKKGGTGVQEWNLQSQGYEDKPNRTLFDMEQLHLGQEFDMLPLPGNMSPSKMVFDPRSSRIYVRYQNLIQRDALKDNFDIDIEALLKREGVPLEGFFGVWEEPDGSKQTWGLHSGPANSGVDYRSGWFRVIAEVTNRMLDMNGRVAFAFQAYKHVEMPSEWSKAFASLATVSRKEYVKTIYAGASPFSQEGDWIIVRKYGSAGASELYRAPKRYGLTNPNGFRGVLGDAERRYSIIQHTHPSSRVSTRSPAKDKELYGKSSKTDEDRIHWGTDWGTAKKQDVYAYACRPGVVERVKYGTLDATKTVWKVFNSHDGKTKTITARDKAEYEAWLTTMTTLLGENAAIRSSSAVSLNGKSVNLNTYQKFGTIVRDVNFVNFYYYTDVESAGNYVVVRHQGTPAPGEDIFDGDISVYMHLKEIHVKKGDIIVDLNDPLWGATDYAGRHDLEAPIGIVGQTSSLSPDYIKHVVGKGSVPARGFGKLNPFNFHEIVQEVGGHGGFTLATHLHFEYWEKESNGLALDRSAEGTPKDFRTPAIIPEGYVVVDPIPSFQIAQNPDSHILNITRTEAEQKIAADLVAKKIQSENGKSYKIDETAVESLIETMEDLATQGWYHYEGSMNLPNVWYKTWILNFKLGEKGELGDPNVKNLGINTPDLDFDGLSTVVTGISGGFTNIVARIPILSHEYPTLQHMGSIEPHYSFEFTCLDEYANLQGISQGGQLLEGMRSSLQRNARKYREIKDSWGVSTDTFITRLLGSYRVDDAVFDNRQSGVVNQVKLLKRTIIDRSDNGTVEGSPGLSFLSFELSETNPYDEEKFININPPLIDVETARRDVLKALYSLDIVDEYKDSVLPVLIGSIANRDILDPSADGYGTFSLGEFDSIRPHKYMAANQTFLLKEPGSEQEFVAVYDTSGVYERLLRQTLEDEFDTHNIKREGEVLLIPFSESDYPISTFDASTVDDPMESPDGLAAASSVTITVKKGYDITKILESSSDLGALSKLNLPKIADYWQMIHALVQSAQVVLAEEASLATPEKNWRYSVGGLPKEEVVAELYDLPIEPQMWRLWQVFSLAAATNFAYLFDENAEATGLSNFAPSDKERAATGIILGNKGWMEWEDTSLDKDLVKLADDGSHDLPFTTTSIVNMAEGTGAQVVSAARQLFWVAAQNPITNFFAWATGQEDRHKGIVDFIGKRPMDAAVEEVTEAIRETENQIVELYWRKVLPTNAIWFQDLAKFWARESLFTPFTRLIGGEVGNEEGPLASVQSQLKKNLHSSGYWTSGVLPGIKIMSPEPVFMIRVDKYSKAEAGEEEGVTPLRYSGQTSSSSAEIGGVKGYDSIYEWPVESEVEKLKVRELKKSFARLADDILSDPKMLTALGLQKYINLLVSQKRVTGTECYPDLQLPEHPYYGTTLDVAPDFYFWNIYDDGQAFHPETMARIRASADHIVENCYQSLKVMQGRNDKSNDMPYTNTSIGDQQVVLPLRYNAEGTDGQSENPSKRGPTGIPWYEGDAAKDSIAAFDSALSTSDLVDDAEALRRVNPPTASMSVTEGDIDSGAIGRHYPSRTSVEVYKKLQERLDSQTKMFGNKAGYALEPEALGPEASKLEGTALAKPLEYTHLFDGDSLKQLAFDATRDIVSQKMTLRRAFPTFKLYFIEEDEIEDRLRAYDDFHSYNGVKEFSVVQSRKIASDVAIITLQNVSGVLDGTRRDAITDLDYFTKKPKVKGKYDSTTSGEAIAEGTDAEQPFEAVVLRPGINIQLRAGYANDPRNLHVLISGRVVDITWNKMGDMAEIMVQGFGAELTQALKGTGESEKIYHTTHHLLGAMMLQSELVHFGRWEKGQLFQEGEAKDSRLDFKDYSREGYLGNFSMTTSIASFLTRHPGITLVAALGFTYLSLFPGGSSVAKGAAKSGFFSRFIKSLSVGKQFDEAALVAGSGSAGTFKKLIPEVIETELKTGGWGGLNAASKARLVEIFGQRVGAAFDVAKATRGWTSAADDIFAKASTGAAEALEKAGTVDEVAAVFAGLGRNLQTLVPTGGLLGNPAATLLQSPLGYLSVNTAKRVLSVGITTMTTSASKVFLVGAGTGLALDGGRALFKPAYDATIGRLARWFDTAQVSLMISPQDDNLFCPHPKDYMNLLKQGPIEAMKDVLGETLINIATASDQYGYRVNRWLKLSENSVWDKRVHPKACEYQIDSSTIWDIFHEMSLRHPGWVYGVRPYGHAFRNTMFFGVPSQRYWSKPASNEFIQRVNKLSKFLAEDGIDLEEYRQLYGNEVEGQNIDELEARFIEEERQASLPVSTERSVAFLPEEPASLTGVVYSPGPQPYYDSYDRAQKAKTRLKAVLSAPAIKEYLRGLELRFVPFRNHHMISSTRDLVWNGIMSSENAVYNAVAVTYVEDERNPDSEAFKTETFKAHSFIPEHMVRVLPLPIYRNCKTYPMAIRYAMGTLVDTMKDMYRGEIIVTGNPRLRPWDIAILTDDYNDMVGPIEIEQVVHTFSHETGFITEVKPSAVVIGNEISSWPLIEAAKLWTLAVRDQESRVFGTADGLGGGITSVTDFLLSSLSESDHKALEEKYRNFYGNEFPFLQDLAKDDGFLESLEPYDQEIEEATGALKSATAGIIGAAGIAAVITGAVVTKKLAGGGRLWNATGVGSLTGLAGIAAAGAGGTVFTLLNNPPSLKMLLGGAVLFAQMAREESVIVVPLMKNGRPIVSGLNIQDPSMMWNNFKGQLRRAVSDTVEGTEDLMRLWDAYTVGAWEKVAEAWDDTGRMDPDSRVVTPDLTEN